MTILELREKRAKAWEAAKAFLDSHRNDKGVLSAEDDAAYTRMEQEITDLGKEIARLERQEALEAELNRPVNKPLTGKPMSGKEEAKTGRATDEYRRNFWNMMRSKAPMPSVVNALQIGTDSEGGYLVPDEYERTLVEALEEENVFRQLARVIQTSSGDRNIPVVATKGTASWIDEEGAYTESDDSFGQVSIGAYKLGTMIKVSEELLNDSVFDLESYISREFARRIGAKEEEAFFTGDGSGKPLGILAASGGAETGITAASATAITADELIDLFYSLKSPYRRNAVGLVCRLGNLGGGQTGNRSPLLDFEGAANHPLIAALFHVVLSVVAHLPALPYDAFCTSTLTASGRIILPSTRWEARKPTWPFAAYSSFRRLKERPWRSAIQ